MEKVNILIFDEEEITLTLVESYLKELTFSYNLQKYTQFDENLFLQNVGNNIIIVNVTKTDNSILEKISKYSKDQRNKFIVISNDNSTDLHVQVLRVGAKDFLLKPIKKSDFLYSLQSIYKMEIGSAPQFHKKTMVYAVTSAEDGVGRTTFMINLAKEIADATKEKVLLIDFNNTMNDISFMLDVDIQMNTSSYLSDLTKENAVNLLSKLDRYQSSSMYVMANGFTRKELGKFDSSNIYNFFQILKEHFKYIFVDIDFENVRLYRDVMINADIIWMIATPSISMFEKLKLVIENNFSKKKVRVVLNKYEKRHEANLETFQSTLGKQIYCKIPKNFIAVGASQSKNKTLKEVAPELDIVKAYVSLAKHIASKG